MLLLTVVCMMLFGVNASASEDDNSLYSLGIITEGVTVSPEFAYNIWSYEVVVPGGTTELLLEPVPSSNLAHISSVNGTVLNEDGTGYVTITVEAGNGSPFTYELHITSDGTVAAEPETEIETESETETETETETEPVTEDPRYVKVDKNTIQEAENTITNLKGQITEYKDQVSMFTKIMYGLIALAVLLLFIVINLLLKKKDLKSELKQYKSYGYGDGKKSKKQLKQEVKEQKKLDKEQAKAEKKQQKMNKKAGNAQDDDMQIYQQAQPAVKPAAMQNGYAPQEPYAQNQPVYQDLRQNQPTYQGLDVQPQVSKKAKQMPQYEQPIQQPKQAPKQPMQQPKQAPQPQSAPVQSAAKPAKKGKKSDVEINMIDL